MNKIDIALLLICLYDSYTLNKKRKRIAELENELIDLKMKAMFGNIEDRLEPEDEEK